MPSDSVMYCFSRKEDAEKLSEQIKESKGRLGYCTVFHNAGDYSVFNPLNNTHHKHMSFGEMLEFILRKWW